MIAKPIAAIALRIFSGRNWATPPPAITPKKLAKTKATVEPKNTARGYLELPPNAIAAN